MDEVGLHTLQYTHILRFDQGYGTMQRSFLPTRPLPIGHLGRAHIPEESDLGILVALSADRGRPSQGLAPPSCHTHAPCLPKRTVVHLERYLAL